MGTRNILDNTCGNRSRDKEKIVSWYWYTRVIVLVIVIVHSFEQHALFSYIIDSDGRGSNHSGIRKARKPCSGYRGLGIHSRRTLTWQTLLSHDRGGFSTHV